MTFSLVLGVLSSVEIILHNANRMLNQPHEDGSLAMITIDFSNAFKFQFGRQVGTVA